MNDLKVVQTLVRTPRLELHHLSGEELFILFEDPENPALFKGKTFSNPYRHLMDEKGPLGWRVPQVRKDPKVNRWFMRWIVLKSTREIIGSLSFHGAPNSEGMIEIGLGILEQFRNQGFAKEALLGIWLWALQDPQVQILRYTVGIENAPSIQVIEFFGFHYMGEQMDDEDGPESIYELSRDEFLRKFGPEKERS